MRRSNELETGTCMAGRSDQDKSTAVRTLARGLLLLEAVAAAPGGVGVTELAETCGLDKGTTSRLLASLRDMGYLRQRPSDRRYLLTGRVMRLARGFVAQFELRELARPHLVRLRDLTNETVHLGVREGSRLVFLDQLETDHALRLASAIGQNLPLHVTAMGRAILAALPAAERDELLEKLLADDRHAELVVDLKQLRNELRTAEARGWATAERGDDVTRLGSAVLDATGAPVAALSVSGPAHRMAPRLAELGAHCRATAQAISIELGA